MGEVKKSYVELWMSNVEAPKQPQRASRQEDTAPVCIGGGGVIGDLRNDGGRRHG